MSTYPLMLFPSSPMKILFPSLLLFYETCLLSLWSPPFPSQFPCSRCGSFLSCQGADIAHLDSLPPYDLVIWSGSTDFFLSAKAAGASLPTAHFAKLRPPFHFWHAHFIQDFPLKLLPFRKLSPGLSSSSNNKYAISLLLPSDSRTVLSSIFPFTSNFLTDLEKTIFTFLQYYQATMGPRTLIAAKEQRG